LRVARKTAGTAGVPPVSLPRTTLTRTVEDSPWTAADVADEVESVKPDDLSVERVEEGMSVASAVAECKSESKSSNEKVEEDITEPQ
jgi:hypothetical protein